MKNRICEILGVAYPIILGPMRLITLGEMAAAVSESGGFGQIAASGLSPDRLRSELMKARDLTNRPIGVNIPLYRPNASEALEIAIEVGIKVITTSAGNPGKFIDRIREAGIKVLHKVSTVDMAVKAEAAGVDGVIATGFEAGGHIGREQVTTLCLVPQLVDVLRIPVVAAGGIGDARGLLAAFALGAEGVEMGTRFLGSSECPVPDFFKELVITAKSDSTLLLGKGAMPIRVLKNKASMMISRTDKAQEDDRLTASGDKSYVQSGGDADSSLMPCGQVAGLITELKNIGEIIPEMMKEVESLSSQLSTIFLGIKGEK
ncbi:MAG: nitronate monooxygenase [Deltaproteobacteria bacterium]|nr:nitronate monooxygenase [Deltaproteobacteria bacterium]MBW1923764.1 nitronate monooxygenase [Deltaproteobacteria bacterium]MBW2101400.1 nitronate monooxygenase [Deltaproteobacteria bacterium]RLB40425.1 MAG: 2-nitropropane dioxygenase [Deltaproteobacteria bacterium]